ncbi:MAG: hypothetical protein ACJAWL_001624 [Motiliproteus sp.]|jgi:hypothetical protein
MTEHEKQIRDKAITYAKANRRRIAKQFACKETYPSELEPVSVFMAGSPGAGKTEASITLLENFDGGVLRIDLMSLGTCLKAIKGVIRGCFRELFRYSLKRSMTWH